MIRDVLYKGNFAAIQGKKICFAGLNAITPSEKLILKKIRENAHETLFFWDYPGERLKAGFNKAAIFIDENLRNFGGELLSDIETLPDIKVISCPNAVSQAQMAGELLETLPVDVINSRKTAVVMAEEGLLIPMKCAVPGIIDAFNVTMGFPLKYSATYSLINIVFDLLKNIRIKNQIKLFYHKDLLKFLRNPLLETIFDSSDKTLLNSVKEHNLIYVTSEELGESKIAGILLQDYSTGEQLTEFILTLLFELFQAIHSKNSTDDNSGNDEIEILAVTIEHITRIKNAFIYGEGIAPGWKLMMKIILRVLESVTVPFNGEPLMGLQIMGLLETRNLDFENVIVTSMNEGFFPKNSAPQSYIPQTLRTGYALPGPERRDAVFTYFFYRLLARSKKIWLLYDSSIEGIK